MIDDTNYNQHYSSGRTMATIAILIAVIALTLAWMAYNRSGEDLEDRVGNSIEGTSQNVGEEVGEETQQGLDTVENAIDTGPDGIDDGAQ